MVFDISENAFESEKERNLYTKFFAGYFLNEFISGYETRLSLLNELLTEKFNKPITLKSPHLSFDNHAYLLLDEGNHGEFADVLLHDYKNNVMVAIEVKFLSDLDVKKDCGENLKRIEEIRKKYPCLKIHFLLLISEKKWQRVEQMYNHPNSNFKKYKDEFKNEVPILYWEELLPLCSEQKVCDFMNKRLELCDKGQSDKDRKCKPC
jgi:hypothetical protein